MTQDFDKFLSDNSVVPEWVFMHPSVWNGYWSVIKRPRWFKVFKAIGRIMRNRRVYWLGLSIYWVDGLKTVFPEDAIITEVKDIFDA